MKKDRNTLKTDLLINAYGKIEGVGTSSFDIYTNLITTGWYWMAIGTWK